jgi:hypothetical protein
VIFEEATASVVAEGLRRALKSVIEEVTKNGGARAEREVAVVLRGMERGAKHEGLAPEAGQSNAASQIPEGESSYLDLVARVFQQSPSRPRREGDPGPDPSKPLIVMP